jgi:glutaredoxin 3
MRYILAFLLLSFGFCIEETYADKKPQSYQVMLYYSPRCPYSQQVLLYLKQNDITVPMKNVSGDDDAKRELVEVGGYPIVPCLFVNGEAIYDVNAIIKWLSLHQQYLS